MVERLKVKVIPPESSTSKSEIPDRRPHQLSSSSSKLLVSTAAHVEDRKLSEILRRLAEHTGE